MRRRTDMMRRGALTLAAALALAGCGTGQGARFEMVRGIVGDLLPGEPAPAGSGAAPTRLTRATVEELGLAMIRARLLEDEGRTILTGVTANGGYVVYVSSFQQTLTLLGSRVTASRGLGFDLLSTRLLPDDPLVAPRPLADWPATVTRTYRFPGPGLEGVVVRVNCTIVPQDPLQIEIVERTYRGRQVEERCAGDGQRFTNYHFVENETGFVWRSVQWLGPDQGQIDVEIVEPFEG